MKATFDISERLLLRLGEVAERRGTTVSALVEAGIFQILSEDRAMMKEKADAEENPLSAEELMEGLPKWRGGKLLVDITNKEELYQVMDNYDGQPPPQTAEELMARLPTWTSGGELVDITDKDELYRVMDEYDGFRY